MSLTPVDLPAAAGRLLDTEITAAQLIAGGSLSQVYRMTLADGATVIVKGGPDPETEAEMLRAIQRAGAPSPRVIAVDGDCLIIEEVAATGNVAQVWDDLGTMLAKLHAAAGEHYGWSSDYAFGNVPIANEPDSDWPEFWSQRRLLTHVPHVDPRLAGRLEALAASIDRFLPAKPRPALLHGDLWGGNILVARGRVSGLIDPACYFGHGEVDIAMLTLFDHPNDHFYAAYGSLEPGHRERIAIYALWPALVHVRLFGSGYIPMADRLLKTAGY